MGEAKRRKQILGNSYGIPNIDEQIKDVWETINASIKSAKQKGYDTILCQCCRDHKGFSIEAIQRMQQQLENWQCPLNVPMLIQMLPEGFKTSESKLFDGFMTVWCNSPNNELWKALFEQKI